MFLKQLHGSDYQFEHLIISNVIPKDIIDRDTTGRSCCTGYYGYWVVSSLTRGRKEEELTGKTHKTRNEDQGRNMV